MHNGVFDKNIVCKLQKITLELLKKHQMNFMDTYYGSKVEVNIDVTDFICLGIRLLSLHPDAR